MSHRALLGLVSAAAIVSTQAATAQSSGDFYAGKTVKIVIGTQVGGEYGLYSNLIAKHIRQFVPGKPTVIIQTMPGAGGIIALNYLANVAPQDGTTLTLAHVPIVQEGLLNPNVKFDPAKFQWIGRLAGQQHVGIASTKSKIRSLEDAKHKVFVAGGTGATNPTVLSWRILNKLAGTKFKIISGYKSTKDSLTAWERGELDVVTASWDIVRNQYKEQLKAGLITPIYVHAMRKPAELSEVPLIVEFGRNAAERAFLQIYAVGTEIGRSLAAPPGVPKERVQVWRIAFMKMLVSPEFKKAVKKGNIRLEPLSGEKLAAIVAQTVRLPAGTVAQAREFYDRLRATKTDRLRATKTR